MPLSSSSIAQHPSTSAESPSTSDDAPSLSKTGNEPSIILKESALNGYAKVFSISNTDKTLLNIELFLNNCMPLLTDTLKVELDSNQCVKFQLFLESRFTHPTGELTVSPQNFKSCSKTLYRSSTDNDINQTLTEDMSSILTEVGEFEGRGSGWTLTEICELQLRISKCSLYTSSGKGYIPLPPIIAKRKAVINPKNIENDVFCFKYSIISKLYTGSANNPTIREIKAIDHNYDFNSLPFPVPITAISKFETNNTGTSVNVFILDNNDILPIRIVDSEAADHFDLLYIPSDATSGHYAYIRDFNRLVRPQIIGTDRRSNRSRLIICKRCFTHKRENQLANPQEWLAEHRTYCKTTRPCQIKLPDEGKKMMFTKQSYHLKIPVAVYMDLESTLAPTSDCMPDPEKSSYSRATHVHENNSACILVESHLPQSLLDEYNIPTVPLLFRHATALHATLERLIEIAKSVSRLYKRCVPLIPLTDEQQLQHDSATHCVLCRQLFTEQRVKCFEHNYLTGSYNGAYCVRCNMEMRLPRHLPILCHNLSKYDAHFILTALSQFNRPITVIPATTETYISFSVQVDDIELRFLDSFRFMSTSLEKLVKALPKDRLLATARHNPADKLHLLTSKGIYPYGYVTRPEVFDEPSLPPIEAFYNDLTGMHITPQDYAHAQQVFSEMQCHSLGDYHDIYLRLDVTLLADVFQDFRELCYSNYLLDPLYTFTSPGFSWECMLLHTQVQMDLITDYDMYLFMEQGIRGGLVQSNVRFIQSNNPGLEKRSDYDPDKETSHIMYFDCNSLYATSLSHHLPVGDLQWVEDVQSIDWRNTSPTSEKGYILEVDVKVPQEVHDKLNDYPPLPQKECPPGNNQTKLLATLRDKSKYIAHYTILQQAESLGLVVTKVYRAVQFKQTAYLKDYVNLNTRLRQQATTDFHKDLFKLFSNVIYGKSLQAEKNKLNVKVITDPAAFLRETSKVTYVGFNLVNENMAIINLAKRQVTLKRPIYLGQSVLDVSKRIMYDLYYNLLKDTFTDTRLVYTDTDSFVIYTKERDVTQALASKADHFDFSNYPKDHPLYSTTNHKVLGKLKDESKSRQIYQFIGLRPKMYAYRYSSDSMITDDSGTTRDDPSKTEKRAKGVKTAALKRDITFRDYEKVLRDNSKTYIKFRTITSRNHTVYTEYVKKLALTCTDDKRMLDTDNNSTVAYGHYSTL